MSPTSLKLTVLPLARFRWPLVVLLAWTRLSIAAGVNEPGPGVTLRSGASTLSCQPGEPASFCFGGDAPPAEVDAEAPAPVCAAFLDGAGAVGWQSATYDTATADAGSLRASGSLRTPAGSVLRFDDTYQPAADGAFFLRRVVTVQAAGAGEQGFLSRFGLRAAEPTALRDCEGFLPGVWYLDNRQVPPRALAADLGDARIWVREDRLPLPLVMLRRRVDGAALSLAHLRPDGGTAPDDLRRPDTLTDARLQFAALGVTTPARPELTVVYPGTEADRTYLRRGGRGPAGAGAWRFHPLQTGFRQEYTLLLAGGRHPAFPAAMRWAWRAAYAQARPTIASVDLRTVYDASLRLLGNVAASYNGVPGLPFCIHLPGGSFQRSGVDVSYQMGFVGQQLPAAYHLLRSGLLTNQPERVRQGEAILDFWSDQSLTPEGLPRTWYDPYPQGHWRDYHTFLRVASDGMNGALQAWTFARQQGRDRPGWLRFCRGYGDWLLAHQNPDGSWFREYDFASHPASQGKQNTAHPIRYLVDLAAATGERRYAEAAARAGEYCLANVHAAFQYVGGTADNPNVIDKEAGFMSLDAFLALHDLTGDPRYLPAATQAADFMETWVYAWNVPPAPDARGRGSLPARLPVSGFSLIATGHSASDLFLAGAPYFYQRLFVATGDPHYLEVARLLLYNPRQFVDVNGSLGYGQPGLVTEALSLAPPRDGGVSVWLPWLTVSIVEPMVRLEETFGSLGLNAADTPETLAAWRTRDARQARTRRAVWSNDEAR